MVARPVNTCSKRGDKLCQHGQMILEKYQLAVSRQKTVEG